MVKSVAEKTPQIGAREIGVGQNAAVHLITRIEVSTDKFSIRKFALPQQTIAPIYLHQLRENEFAGTKIGVLYSCVSKLSIVK